MFIISGLFYKQKIFLFAPDNVLWKKKFYLAQAAQPADVYRSKGSAWLRPLGADTLLSSRQCSPAQKPSERFFSFIFFDGLSVFGGAARRASARGKFLVRCSAMLKTYLSWERFTFDNYAAKKNISPESFLRSKPHAS